MDKVTFGGLTRDHDAGFTYFNMFVNNNYVGFAEEFHDRFVFWGLSDTGKNFVGGHIGRYVDGVGYDSLDELEDDLETREEN